MIKEHWGLEQAPFTLHPDVRFLFESIAHREGLARLLFAVGELRGGITLLTGEIGCGKTTLARSLLRLLPAERYRTAFIVNPMLPAGQLLAAILREFGGDRRRGSKAELAAALHAHLAALASRRILAVLIVDEAQVLGHTQLEELRLLTNLETSAEKLLHLVLIGQPELAARAARFPELAQRITMRFHLRPLSFAETGNYVGHRLRVAGASETLFTAGAIAEIYRRTGGVPRLINIACAHALFLAAAAGRSQVDAAAAASAAREIDLTPERAPARPAAPPDREDPIPLRAARLK
jgi:general secretion pathway protein A